MNELTWNSLHPNYIKYIHCLKCDKKSKILRMDFYNYPNANVLCSNCYYLIKCKYCLTCPFCNYNYFFAAVHNKQLICPAGHKGTTDMCSIS